MPPRLVPSVTTHAPNGMVCSVDHLASSAGVGVLRDGGNAVDAAVATSAVLAVTTQHMCGMGGDLFALVHGGSTGPPTCLNAAGRAGSGADAGALRDRGHAVMPFRDHMAPVTVPGCVDGWTTLHDRHGRLDLDRVLADAIAHARDGFPASPLLAVMCDAVRDVQGADDYAGVRRTGDHVRRPRIAEHLAAVVEGGRGAFYEGSFGEALLTAGEGLFAPDDLARCQAEWVDPLDLDVFGHRVFTVPPSSQGYLSLSSAWIAERLPLPDSPDDGGWPHLLAEAARAAGHDRTEVLFDGADGPALLAEARLAPRVRWIDPEVRTELPEQHAAGGTVHLVTADRDGMAVSLIQSNASGWGAHVVADGVFLHNRGNGFSLEAGHPAEYGPGRRPPHTLAPALVTTADGSLRAVLGTMGGDSQPQVVLQMLTRLLVHDQAPGAVIDAPRWVLGGSSTGFDLWAADGPSHVRIESTAPEAWEAGLTTRGHRVEVEPAWGPGFGHAHLIEADPAGGWRGASDPRALTGSAAGL